MEYEAKGPIYLQISDVVCENIMAERWQEGSRVPSVRELAVEAEVNPNTVMRTYSHLQDQQIIQNQRGIGYFVAENAHKKTRELKKRNFVNRELPLIMKTMDLLNLSFEDLKTLYEAKQKEEKR